MVKTAKSTPGGEHFEHVPSSPDSGASQSSPPPNAGNSASNALNSANISSNMTQMSYRGTHSLAHHLRLTDTDHSPSIHSVNGGNSASNASNSDNFLPRMTHSSPNDDDGDSQSTLQPQPLADSSRDKPYLEDFGVEQDVTMQLGDKPNKSLMATRVECDYDKILDHIEPSSTTSTTSNVSRDLPTVTKTWQNMTVIEKAEVIMQLSDADVQDIADALVYLRRLEQECKLAGKPIDQLRVSMYNTLVGSCAVGNANAHLLKINQAMRRKICTTAKPLVYMFLGMEKSAKTTLLVSLTHLPLGVITAAMATRSPTIMIITHDPTCAQTVGRVYMWNEDSSIDDDNNDSTVTVTEWRPLNEVFENIAKITERIAETGRAEQNFHRVTKRMLKVEIKGKHIHMSGILIDMPGRTNIEGGRESEAGQQLKQEMIDEATITTISNELSDGNEIIALCARRASSHQSEAFSTILTRLLTNDDRITKLEIADPKDPDVMITTFPGIMMIDIHNRVDEGMYGENGAITWNTLQETLVKCFASAYRDALTWPKNTNLFKERACLCTDGVDRCLEQYSQAIGDSSVNLERFSNSVSKVIAQKNENLTKIVMEGITKGKLNDFKQLVNHFECLAMDESHPLTMFGLHNLESIILTHQKEIILDSVKIVTKELEDIVNLKQRLQAQICHEQVDVEDIASKWREVANVTCQIANPTKSKTPILPVYKHPASKMNETSFAQEYKDYPKKALVPTEDGDKTLEEYLKDHNLEVESKPIPAVAITPVSAPPPPTNVQPAKGKQNVQPPNNVQQPTPQVAAASPIADDKFFKDLGISYGQAARTGIEKITADTKNTQFMASDWNLMIDMIEENIGRSIVLSDIASVIARQHIPVIANVWLDAICEYLLVLFNNLCGSSIKLSEKRNLITEPQSKAFVYASLFSTFKAKVESLKAEMKTRIQRYQPRTFAEMSKRSDTRQKFYENLAAMELAHVNNVNNQATQASPTTYWANWDSEDQHKDSHQPVNQRAVTKSGIQRPPMTEKTIVDTIPIQVSWGLEDILTPMEQDFIYEITNLLGSNGPETLQHRLNDEYTHERIQLTINTTEGPIAAVMLAKEDNRLNKKIESFTKSPDVKRYEDAMVAVDKFISKVFKRQGHN